MDGRHENMVWVYSVKARKWSTMQGFNSGYLNGEVSIFANGALYLVECYRTSWGIVTLDLVAKRYGKIALPSYEDGGIYWTLGVSRGCLVACCNYEEPNRADLWAIKEYGVEKSWTKLVTISSPVDRKGYMSPLFVAGNSDVVLVKLGREIVLYISRNGSFKRLTIIRPVIFLNFKWPPTLKALLHLIFSDASDSPVLKFMITLCLALYFYILTYLVRCSSATLN
ncbi:F-box/kelch-repeat protein At3g23880-like [Lycium ferocissimum]|uniref:F-box/kelch-repeat protein At3g23880-like n=1 Tax=Lycium ferocissimum TaxID=112874 RepID=UPI00281574B9|nr:F-box/kelch-repeat protein At3g23880-like [Lycium ferocissimum]